MSIHLGQVLLTAVVTAAVGLLVTESYQTTPWLADKLMRWSVRLRYTDNPERATVRGEELISLLEDLPTLFKLPTAGGFFFRALAYRLAHRRGRARREPRAGQRPLGARFRIALVKASLVFICTGTVFGIEVFVVEVFFNNVGNSLISGSVLGILVGISAASEVVSQSLRLRPGLVGGIVSSLSVFGPYAVAGYTSSAIVAESLLVGAAFGLVAALTSVLMSKSKRIGVALGFLSTFVSVALEFFMHLPPSRDLFLLIYINPALMAGFLAGFAVAFERGTWRKAPRDRSSVLPLIPGAMPWNTRVDASHSDNGLSPQPAPGHIPDDCP
ncbi:MAG: hypothetical protein ACRDRI_10915 [Pseudonocardiaceae bacterium]